MTVIVPIGFLVGVDDIAGHTHYLYYHEEQLIAFVIAFCTICTDLFCFNFVRCWLNHQTGFIWSYIIPVTIILLVGTLMFHSSSV